MKSTVEQIWARFDNEVERFSNLETGQTATMDAPLVLELLTHAAAVTTPHARHMLDVGCGAGNYALKLLERLPNRDVTLLDLSLPMLARASERVGAHTKGYVTTIQSGIRDAVFQDGEFDIILAAMTLHHLRTEAEWETVIAKLYASLAPGGSLWIADITEHAVPAVTTLMTARYGEYLARIGGETYRDNVFASIEQEDTPRPLLYQTDLLRTVGFAQIDILHRNNRFAAFGAVKE